MLLSEGQGREDTEVERESTVFLLQEIGTPWPLNCTGITCPTLCSKAGGSGGEGGALAAASTLCQSTRKTQGLWGVPEAGRIVTMPRPSPTR